MQYLTKSEKIFQTSEKWLSLSFLSFVFVIQI